jgi:hypothetical protein
MSNFKKYYYSITESYLKMVETPNSVKNYYNLDYIIFYVNPTDSEQDELFENSLDQGLRIGIDKLGNIYCWADGILHTDAESLLDKDFTLKLEYTKGRDKIFLSTAEVITSKDELLKVLNKAKLNKIRLIFPEVKTIEMNRKPYTKLYDFSEKVSFKSFAHNNIDSWIQDLSFVDLKEYVKKHPKLKDETKKKIEKEIIIRNLERSRNKYK